MNTRRPNLTWAWLIVAAAVMATVAPVAYGQTRGGGAEADTVRKVYLLHASTLSFDEHRDTEHWPIVTAAGDDSIVAVRRQVLTGDVAFRQDSAYMYCDKAYFYQEHNSFKAFGNVRMEQGDTLRIYCDSLFYDGDALLGYLYDHVRLEHNDQTLFTEYMTYDRSAQEAQYPYSGVIVDPHDHLRSQVGWYYPNRREAFFQYDVELRSYPDTVFVEALPDIPREHPQAVLYSDTLRYDFDASTARVVGTSRIELDTATLYTMLGSFNTKTLRGRLYRQSYIVSPGRYATGDTLHYDGRIGVGDAWGQVVAVDSMQRVKMTGDYAHYVAEPQSVYVTGHALAMEYSTSDTLFLHGDTLRAYTLLAPHVEWRAGEVVYDTLWAQPDTDTIARIDSEADVPGRSPLFGDAFGATSLTHPLAENTDRPSAPDAEAIGSASDSLVTVGNVGIQSSQVFAPVEEAADSLTTDVGVTREGPALAGRSLDTAEKRSDNPSYPQDEMQAVTAEGQDGSSPVDTVAYRLKERQLPAVADTCGVDTLRFMDAYYNVRYYRRDVQGICDSLHYSVRDSLATFVGNPVMWNEMYQITGDTIFAYIDQTPGGGGGINRALVHDNALLVQERDTLHYDQIGGQHLVCYFDSSQVRQMDMDGSVNIIYYPEESDGRGGKQLIGLNQMIGNYLTVWFRDRKMDRLRVWPDVVGSLTPIQLVTDEILYLDKFRWMSYLRPTDSRDVFRDVRMREEDKQETVRLFDEDELNGY